MKKSIEVNIGRDVEAEALRILRAIPDLDVTVGSALGKGHRADAVVRHGGSETPIAVQVKRRVNVATAHQIAQMARGNVDMPLLLLAVETTADARRVLAEENIVQIDGFGNAHLELPGLILRLTGTTKPAPTRAPSTLSGKSGLVAQALLLGHEREWHVKDLAETAGTSAGLVHRVLNRLDDEGIVATSGTGPNRTRRVANPTALLDLWTEEQADKATRTLGYHLAQTPHQLIDDLGDALESAGITHAFTGAAGATLVAPLVTTVAVAKLWIGATASTIDLLDATAATRVAEGHNVAFLQAPDDTPLAFRANVDGTWVTNVYRLYLDLRRDPRRGAAQADHLREQVIGF